MSEITIKIVRIIFYVFLVLLVLRTLSVLYTELVVRGKIKEQIREVFQKKGEKFSQDLKNIFGLNELFSPPSPFPPSEKEGLKLSLDFFQTEQTSEKIFSISFFLSRNKIYWKLSSDKPPPLFILPPFLFQWNDYEMKKEELEELYKLEEILRRKGIVKSLEKIEQGYKIEIDKERLKEGIFEWKKEWQTKEGENFFTELKEISGIILIDPEKFIKNIHLKTVSFNVVLKVENLKERVLANKKEENLESFLISLFQKYAQLF